MSLEPVTDETARQMRLAWFRFVDTVEPHRSDLHRYALRLTGEIFAAEDLVQDALLRGFAAIARGDLHGPDSRVRDARAYLFRIASNLWVDQVRRAEREAGAEAEPLPMAAGAEDLASVRDAGERLFAAAAPQERAAIVLKEVFDFSLREIAEMLDTTDGAVKAALHRGRAKVEAGPPPPPRHRLPSKVLLDRFVAAFNARDAKALTACLLDTVAVEVPGVGGGRGNAQIWVEKSIEFTTGEVQWREIGGQPVVLLLGPDGVLYDVTRIEEADSGVSRIIDYCYCPDTLKAVAATLGLAVRTIGYHQPPKILQTMVASTQLGWVT